MSPRNFKIALLAGAGLCTAAVALVLVETPGSRGGTDLAASGKAPGSGFGALDGRTENPFARGERRRARQDGRRDYVTNPDGADGESEEERKARRLEEMAMAMYEPNAYQRLGVTPESSGLEIYEAMKREQIANSGLTEEEFKARRKEERQFRKQMKDLNLPKKERRELGTQCRKLRKEGAPIEDCMALLPAVAYYAPEEPPKSERREGKKSRDREGRDR